jgi:phosphate transport system protein
MATTHIVKSYDNDLNRLSYLIQEMGKLADRQLSAAIEAIQSRDNEKAEHTRAGDAVIDALEDELNELTLNILALRQPMASDLRLIIGSMKIARDLERIGDYAANLAKRTRTLNANSPLGLTDQLVHMGGLVQPLLKTALDGFMRQDTALVSDIVGMDDAVDALYKKLINDLMDYMQSNPKDVVACTNLLFMAKNFERIGDRATNIAENVYFIVEGTLPHAMRQKQK